MAAALCRNWTYPRSRAPLPTGPRENASPANGGAQSDSPHGRSVDGRLAPAHRPNAGRGRHRWAKGISPISAVGSPSMAAALCRYWTYPRSPEEDNRGLTGRPITTPLSRAAGEGQGVRAAATRACKHPTAWLSCSPCKKALRLWRTRRSQHPAVMESTRNKAVA